LSCWASTGRQVFEQQRAHQVDIDALERCIVKQAHGAGRGDSGMSARPASAVGLQPGRLHGFRVLADLALFASPSLALTIKKNRCLLKTEFARHDA